MALDSTKPQWDPLFPNGEHLEQWQIFPGLAGMPNFLLIQEVTKETGQKLDLWESSEQFSKQNWAIIPQDWY